jgi:hypothetical protein
MLPLASKFTKRKRCRPEQTETYPCRCNQRMACTSGIRGIRTIRASVFSLGQYPRPCALASNSRCRALDRARMNSVGEDADFLREISENVSMEGLREIHSSRSKVGKLTWTFIVICGIILTGESVVVDFGS